MLRMNSSHSTIKARAETHLSFTENFVKEIILLINIHVTVSGLLLNIDEKWSRYN